MKTRFNLELCSLIGLWQVLALLNGLSLSVRATTNTVTSALDNGGAGTLRYWIAASANGGTINFAPGLNGSTIVLTTNLTIGRNLNIVGPGMANLAISGNNACRVFEILPNFTATISGLTITGGKNVGTNAASSGDGGSGYGGGILNGGNLSLSSCNISGNSAVGGMAAGYGFPYTCGSGQGGGIYNYGNLTLFSCAISGNSVQGGSFNSLYSLNPGDGRGGGIDNDNGILTLTGCTIAGNSAQGGVSGGSGYGGGIANNNGMLLLTNCTLAANAASGADGIIVGGSGGWGQGGAIWNTGGSAGGTWFSCTISGNNCSGGTGFMDGHAGGSAIGGGFYNSGICTNKNNIISGNNATGGSGDLGAFSGASYGPDVYGATTSRSFNLIGKTNDSSGWHSFDLTGSIAVPLDPLLGPLQNNGGPTPTMALQLGSPAIDNGLNDYVSKLSPGLTTDQRGFARRVDIASASSQSGANTTDIGAFEFQPNDGLPLSIKRTNNLVMVSWTSASASYNLQTITNLSNTNWGAPVETINDNGTIKYILINPAKTNRFYRLMSP